MTSRAAVHRMRTSSHHLTFRFPMHLLQRDPGPAFLRPHSHHQLSLDTASGPHLPISNLTSASLQSRLRTLPFLQRLHKGSCLTDERCRSRVYFSSFVSASSRGAPESTMLCQCPHIVVAPYLAGSRSSLRRRLEVPTSVIMALVLFQSSCHVEKWPRAYAPTREF